MTKDEYIKALEDFISDELLPMYQAGCRSSGRTPSTSEILKKLSSLQKEHKPLPALLRKPSTSSSKLT